RTIIAAKENNRFAIETEFLQERSDLADICVKASDHRGVVLLLLWPFFPRVGFITWHFHTVTCGSTKFVVSVWESVSQIKKERLVVLASDEFKRFARKQIV